MATYEFRYRLQVAPEARNDGSAMVALDIYGVHRLASTSNPYVEVPGRHKTVLVPASGISTALATGTNTQKTTKIKDLVATNLFAQAPVVPELWTQSGLQTYMDANDLSAAQATAMHNFLTVTLSQVYPITFAL